MYIFYLLALCPSIIGGILFIFNRRVVWQEWLCGTAIAFLVSGIMHGIALYGMCADIETWSGKITQTSHFPQWVEQYQQQHTQTYTTGSGKNQRTHTRTWYTTEHATHHEHWTAYLNFGQISEEKDISLQLFNEIKANFGGVIEDGGKQSTSHGGHFDGGDNNIYATQNRTGYIYPVTTIRKFENRIKAAPTVFSFAKVPEGTKVYEWPQNPNWMQSDRLLGVTGINQLEFDRMNTRLGPRKLVNVIVVQFNSSDSMLGQWQEAKFIGGKKNDLVLCYGKVGTNVVWSRVFGWTEREIKSTYVKKDWSKFSYISIEPPTWAYITLISVMILTQLGLWLWFMFNDYDKGGQRIYSLYR